MNLVKRKGNKMNRVEFEQLVVNEIHNLPFNYILSLKENKKIKKRPLGLLEGKVKFVIKDDFKMTDEEFLQS